MDGWGHGEPGPYNAIDQAKTPVWDQYWERGPRTLLHCSGEHVGLPRGQMGNSEVGHMTIGAGRVVHQDLVRINHAVEDCSIFESKAIREVMETGDSGAIHILGLASSGGVHSHESHIEAFANFLAQSNRKIYIHAFLDGRDTPPKSAQRSLSKLEQLTAKKTNVVVASLTGRYFAMDRDKHWQRTQQTYDMLTGVSKVPTAENALAALEMGYELDRSDEFVRPIRIQNFESIQDGDTVIFMNFRADRAIQLSQAFVLDEFDVFQRKRRPLLSRFLTMTPYSESVNSIPSSIAVESLLPDQIVDRSFGECVAECGMSQLRIAESEKSAHVTYFFSGGNEKTFGGEQRCLVPSPSCSTYDLKPRMSADQITEQICTAVEANSFDVIIGNFANADMVGHTGNFSATIETVECLDECLGSIFESCNRTGAQCFVTADHGNAESMFSVETKQENTAHTTNMVPFLYVGPRGFEFSGFGSLCDIAPTMLQSMDLVVPLEMTGKSLINRSSQ